MAKQKWQVTRDRVLGRRDAFIASRGSCEQCGATRGLSVSWRSRENRPVLSLWHFWDRSQEFREANADLLIVLCPEHRRLNIGGPEHGGGVKGVQSCKCDPCKAKYREYFRNKMRDRREKEKQ